MEKKWKYLTGLLFCNAYRLLRVIPNNDPVMGFTLPLARSGKWWHSFLFPATAMVSFDFLTGKIGIWTAGTALAYGLIGVLFYKYFKGKKKVKLKTYAKASVFGVLLFDFLTGVVMSSYIFEMPFTVAFIGQIPFTALHLASATFFTLVLAPVLDPQIALEVNEHISILEQKIKNFNNALEAI